jgi:four helix bundle protein
LEKKYGFVETIYKLTQTFPDTEKWFNELGRRAAVSIPSNITGAARQEEIRNIHFCILEFPLLN